MRTVFTLGHVLGLVVIDTVAKAPIPKLTLLASNCESSSLPPESKTGVERDVEFPAQELPQQRHGPLSKPWALSCFVFNNASSSADLQPSPVLLLWAEMFGYTPAVYVWFLLSRHCYPVMRAVACLEPWRMGNHGFGFEDGPKKALPTLP